MGDVETSFGRTMLESKELLRRLDRKEIPLAEAGAVGVLKIVPEAEEEEEEEEWEEKNACVAEETIDLPTNDFCSATIAGKSIPEVIIAMGFHASISNWGVMEGEPRAEEDAEAPDSEEADRTGG